jgi:hypothetical protein
MASDRIPASSGVKTPTEQGLRNIHAQRILAQVVLTGMSIIAVIAHGVGHKNVPSRGLASD